MSFYTKKEVDEIIQQSKDEIIQQSKDEIKDFKNKLEQQMLTLIQTNFPNFQINPYTSLKGLDYFKINDELHSLQETTNNLQETTNNLQETVNNLQETVNNLQQTTNNLKLKVIENDEDNDELKVQIFDNDKENDELQKRIEELKIKIAENNN